jgi:hypothetical protein
MATLPTEELPEMLRAILDAHGSQLVEELRLLEQMPQVHRLTERTLFDRALPSGSKAQLRGAIVRVACCNKQVDQKCNDKADEMACPTFIEALQLLRAKIAEKHGSLECLKKAEVAGRDADGSSKASTSSSRTIPEDNSFIAMMAAAAARQAVDSNLRKAELRHKEALEQMQRSTVALEAAMKAVEEVWAGP